MDPLDTLYKVSISINIIAAVTFISVSCFLGSSYNTCKGDKEDDEPWTHAVSNKVTPGVMGMFYGKYKW
jgi:hypothetical protein